MTERAGRRRLAGEARRELVDLLRSATWVRENFASMTIGDRTVYDLTRPLLLIAVHGRDRFARLRL